ncbi:MAG TPA: 16S rRNA processing protein RimM [Deltaproteobacteria bacterium]|nr:16S rRNA processing protein RimM [Deltaproteobacteria bacterium]
MKRDLIEIAQIHGSFGLHGKIQVKPYGESFAQFKTYTQLIIGKSGRPLKVVSCIQSTDFILLELEGISRRDQVERLRGETLFITRDQLGSTDQDEEYWRDIIGLQAIDLQGRSLGTVVSIFSTGSNDVYVVDPEKHYYIPATKDVVREISVEKGFLRIDTSLLEDLLD